MTTRTEQVTEEKLHKEFDEIHRKVAEQILRYEASFPELPPAPQSQENVVVQPVYRYDVRAVS